MNNNNSEKSRNFVDSSQTVYGIGLEIELKIIKIFLTPTLSGLNLFLKLMDVCYERCVEGNYGPGHLNERELI